jgi:hypothetical protein
MTYFTTKIGSHFHAKVLNITAHVRFEAFMESECNKVFSSNQPHKNGNVTPFSHS